MKYMNEQYMNRKTCAQRDYKSVMKVKGKQILKRRMKMALFLLIFCLCSSALFTFHSKAMSEKQRYKYYTKQEIQYGNTLWEISGNYEAFGYQSRLTFLNEIKSINHISDDKLTAGDFLIVPYYSDECIMVQSDSREMASSL